MPLRRPTTAELTALDALCLRSKAHWGYDETFMAACAPHLRVRPELIERDLTRVATLEGDRSPAGVVQVSLEGELAELELLFVDPPAMRRGVGRLMFEWSTEAIVSAGARAMTILSDPGARHFYEAMGAQFLRMAPSDAIAGRELPLLEWSAR